MENKKIKLFNELVALVFKYGERKPKKHGDWIKLQYTNDIYFSLDSWSNALSIKKGIGEYCYFNGFGKDDESIYIGIYFGKCEVHQPEDLLQFWVDGLKLHLKEKL